jgi:hypothetical protein
MMDPTTAVWSPTPNVLEIARGLRAAAIVLPPPTIIVTEDSERLIREYRERLPEPRPPIAEFALEEITPETAQLLLDASTPAERPVSPELHEAVARNGVPCCEQAIGIFEDTLICGGRHRCMAIVAGGHPVITVVRRSYRRSTQEWIGHPGW